jgi:hypothetical protein
MTIKVASFTDFHNESIHGKRKRLVGRKLTEVERVQKHNQLFTKVEHEVLIGTLLGDASFSREKRTTVDDIFRLQFAGGQLHYDYIKHLHNLFKDFITKEEPTIDTIAETTDKKTGKI